MKDFFISYHSANIEWAEWIAEVLEEEGHIITLEPWDSKPDNNFIREIRNASKFAGRIILLISNDYIKIPCTLEEWFQVFSDKIEDRNVLTIPIKVEECFSHWRQEIIINVFNHRTDRSVSSRHKH